MKKSGADPNVKKVFIRNSITDVKKSQPKPIIHVTPTVSTENIRKQNKEPKREVPCLDKPNIKSSDVLATYIEEVKSGPVPRLTLEDVKKDNRQIAEGVTKKLNFHFNDRIYKNLIALNADIQLSSKKEKKFPRTTMKKDLEPNLDDFYTNETKKDMILAMPIIRPKFSKLKNNHGKKLHDYFAKYDNL